MFEGNETEEEKKAAEEKALVDAQGTMLKHPDDSLYYSGSHLHHDTQVGIAFFHIYIFSLCYHFVFALIFVFVFVFIIFIFLPSLLLLLIHCWFDIV